MWDKGLQGLSIGSVPLAKTRLRTRDLTLEFLQYLLICCIQGVNGTIRDKIFP